MHVVVESAALASHLMHGKVDGGPWRSRAREHLPVRICPHSDSAPGHAFADPRVVHRRDARHALPAQAVSHVAHERLEEGRLRGRKRRRWKERGGGGTGGGRARGAEVERGGDEEEGVKVGVERWND